MYMNHPVSDHLSTKSITARFAGRFAALLAVLALTFVMAPLATAPQAFADEGIVPYIDATGQPHDCMAYTLVTSEDTAWSNGWYVVKGEVTLAERVAVTGEVNLILCDGAKLNANKGITVHADNSFTIWCQEGKSGQLVAKASGGDSGIGSTVGGWLGNITITGGHVKASGGMDKYGIGGGGGVNDDQTKVILT